MITDLRAELRRHNLLRTLVKRQIVAEAVCSSKIQPEELKEAKNTFFRKHGLKEQNAIEMLLNKEGLSGDDLNWQIELPLRIKSHCDEHYLHKAEAHFLSRKNQLDRVVYSLLRTKDYYLASEMYLRIEANEANFADLASCYAEGHERMTKGVIGPVSLTQAHPALAERLRTSQPGVLMEPIKINEWWLVARLESYTPATFDTAMASRLSEELFDSWVEDETDRRISSSYSLNIAEAAK